MSTGYDLIKKINEMMDEGADCEEAIIEGCLTYDDYGLLLTWLLSYFTDSEHDEAAMEMLVSMFQDYREDQGAW